MKNIYKITFLLSGLLCFGSSTYAQKTYINQEWENTSGSIGAIQRTASAIDNNENLIVVSNTINSSNNTDVLVTKYSPDGVILWQQTYNGSANGNDYGVQLKINNSNEIFIAATLEESTSLDFGILKYSPNGNLIWSNSWNGSASGVDISADIDIDNSGNIYLVGGSESSNNFSDYAIVKFNSDGVYQWYTTYDHTNLHDAATSITFNSSNLVVSGASASAPTNWDYATLEINKANGFIINTERTDVPGVGLDNVVAITSDNNNNTYLTGYVEVNGNRNIQTVKINSNFGLEWVKNFDGGLEDVAKAIGVDDFGNIYIAGTKENTNGGKDYITIKYDQNGNEIWNREFGSGGSDDVATAEHLAVSDIGDVIITGSIENNNEKKFGTVKYTSNGDLKFVKTFDAGNQNNEAKSIIVKNDNIYVSGVAELNGVNQNATVKYRNAERPIVPRIVNGIESHVKNEIIVRFDTSAIINSAVDKRGFNFGRLNEFVQPNAISQLQNVYPKISWGKLNTYKIFKHFTTADSTFINRLGDEVKIDQFWTILVINVGEENEITVCDALNANQVLFPTVKYAHTNGLVEPVSNDPFYPTQQSLMSTTYPDGHINVEPAWAIETGSDKIKIGVIDTGIKWDHEDLGGSYASYGTKVKGGYDYKIDDILKFTPNNGDPIIGGNANGHGTKVAGIIGSLRNNSNGIAGIAGGNWPYANVPPGDGQQTDPIPAEHNIGPVMHGFRALEIDFASPADEIVAAMLDAAVWTALYPESMDIINNSWKRTVEYSAETPIITAQNMLKDAHRQIFRSGVINVCSRGNEGNTKKYFPAYAEREEWVISVGGNAKGGEKHLNSSFGGDVDLIAPYDQDIVYTINNNSTTSYGDFSGTSAAAPHVTGVVGLMLSHIDWQPSTPNNLAPDDVEFLLQRYADDRDSSYGTNYANGYDDYSGWGRLDAGAVMEKIDRTQYIIKHIKTETQLPTNLSGVPQISGNFNYNDNVMPHDNYQGTIYQVPFILQNNLNSGDVILDYWPLNSYTTLLDNDISNMPGFINKEAGQMIASMNNTVGDIRGTIIHLTQDGNGNAINYWYPAAPGQLARVGYTLHLQSAYANTEENEEQILNISCFPNPSSNNVTLSFVVTENSDVDFDVVDLSGRLIYESDELNFPVGQHSINIESDQWTNGIYFIKLKANEKSKTVKFIKQ